MIILCGGRGSQLCCPPPAQFSREQRSPNICIREFHAEGEVGPQTRVPAPLLSIQADADAKKQAITAEASALQQQVRCAAAGQGAIVQKRMEQEELVAGAAASLCTTAAAVVWHTALPVRLTARKLCRMSLVVSTVQTQQKYRTKVVPKPENQKMQ
jgi:hypothetical protein